MQRDVQSLTNSLSQFLALIVCLLGPRWGEAAACGITAQWLKLSLHLCTCQLSVLGPALWLWRAKGDNSLVMKPCPPHQHISPCSRDIFREKKFFGGVLKLHRSFPVIYFAVFPSGSWIQTFFSVKWKSYTFTGKVFYFS